MDKIKISSVQTSFTRQESISSSLILQDEELGMNGVLIYTIAGSEGSYGGITSICDDNRIGKLIESAMIRVIDRRILVDREYGYFKSTINRI